MSSPKGRLGRQGRPVAPALLVALVLPLAACSTTSDPLVAAATAPGQYDLYDCPAIKVEGEKVATRLRELEGLMARAGRGPAGGLVNATTYQPEYITERGKMKQLRRVATEKHCNFDPAVLPATDAQLPPPPKTPIR